MVNVEFAVSVLRMIKTIAHHPFPGRAGAV